MRWGLQGKVMDFRQMILKVLLLVRELWADKL